MSGIVEVGAKPEVDRTATAAGLLRLRPETVAALRAGKGPKGDPLPSAEVAALLAVKRTPDLLPHCHPIPVSGVDAAFRLHDDGIRGEVTVRARWKTGVEMEALAGVTVGLLCAWDMTKALEKDAHGQYPATRLEDVRVVRKEKG